MKKIKIKYPVLIVSLIIGFFILFCGYGAWEDKLEADMTINLIHEAEPSIQETDSSRKRAVQTGSSVLSEPADNQNSLSQ